MVKRSPPVSLVDDVCAVVMLVWISHDSHSNLLYRLDAWEVGAVVVLLLVLRCLVVGNDVVGVVIAVVVVLLDGC